MQTSELSRRDMLKLLASGLAGAYLVGCAPAFTATPTAAPTSVPPAVPTSAPVAAPTLAPTATVPAAFNYKRFQGQSIAVELTKNPVADLIYDRIPEFQTLTGINVVAEDVPEQQARQKVVIQMSAKSSQIDSWQSSPLEKRMFFKGGWFQPINAYLKDPTLTFPDFNQNDIGKGAWDMVTQPDGSITGLPLQLPTIFLAYRKDLVEAKGLKLDTLDDLEAAVKALHNPPTIYGHVGRGLKNANMSTLSALIGNFGGNYLDKDRKLAMTSPEVVAAAEYYVRLMKYSPPGSIGYNWNECQAAFLAGQAAFWIDGSDLLAVADDPAKSKVAGKVGYMVLPKGPGGQRSPLSGNSMSISAFSTKKEAAYFFLQWAISLQMQVKALLVGTPAVRDSAWKAPDFLTKTTLPKSWIDAQALAPKIGFPYMPEIVPVTEFRDTFGDALTKAIGGGNLAQLFKDAQAQFDPIYAKSEQ